MGKRRSIRASVSGSLGDALRPFRLRFLWAGLYFVVICAVGTIGYWWIEDWRWFDAFYMSVTTVSAVGYMEVHPLSPSGRSFSMVLIAFGVTGLGIWWALITALIVQLDLGGILRRRRTMKSLERMKDHIIICGAGRTGRVVIQEMVRSGQAFVLVDNNQELIPSLQEDFPDLLVIEGDAMKEHSLQSARVGAARGLAACLGEDADNLMLCLTARALNPNLVIAARVNDEEDMDKLRTAGADHAISPNVTGGIRIAATLIRPSVISFLDVATTGRDIDLRLEEAPLPVGSPLVNKTLADARIPQQTGLIVLALRRADEEGSYVYNPAGEVRLEQGDVMLVLGRPEQLESLRAYAEG